MELSKEFNGKKIIWFIESKYNILIGMDVEQKRVVYIIKVPKALRNRVDSYGITINDKILFWSEYFSGMVIFDICKADFKMTSSKEKRCNRLRRNSVYIDGNLYIFPLKRNENVILYDIANNEFRLVNKSKLPKCIMAVYRFDDNSVLLVDGNESRLVIFNPVADTCVYLKVQGYDGGMRDVCFDEHYIYCLSLLGTLIFVFDRYSYEYIKTIAISTDNTRAFQCIIDCNDYLLLLKRDSKKSLIVDKTTTKCEELRDDIVNDEFVSAVRIDEKILWIRKDQCIDGVIDMFDISHKIGEEISYYCDKVVNIVVNDGQIIEENRLLTLEKYLEHIRL
ncbi:hypothetical protein [Butyrivibrio hungatei]|uniref:hypothetical protein n=1 Tax=Butyrivibrio hungatei TaxID=185008 RepID=UPI0003FCCC5B|nr:hypothetical protein [Butyrivibrio hungatei]